MPVSAMSLSDAGARVCLPSSEDIQGVAKFRCGTVFKKDWPFEEFLIFLNSFFFALLICFVLFVFLVFFCFFNKKASNECNDLFCQFSYYLSPTPAPDVPCLQID